MDITRVFTPDEIKSGECMSWVSQAIVDGQADANVGQRARTARLDADPCLLALVSRAR